MNAFRLSSRENWVEHWRKHELLRVIPENYSWDEYIKEAAGKVGGSGTAIELGGFPGSFSAYLKKYCQLNVTLLDYLVDHDTVNRLFSINGLDASRDLIVVEADVFLYEPIEHYDFVCSFGLVEHFTDLESILRAHTKFMRAGGTLFITLPNFRGVNGLLQKFFDPANLAIHNLAVMDLGVLSSCLINVGMVDIEVQYYPSTQVWLEGLHARNIVLRLIVRALNKLMVFIGKVFGNRNRWVSNSIVICAKKPLVK